jgi:hypothetical protein
VGKKTRKSDNGQLDELRELVAETVGDVAQPKKTDRRGMLRMAGAAVLGAAGMAAVKVLPASAASGGNMIIGVGNTATTDTTITNSGGATGFSAVGANGLMGTGASGAPGEIGVIGQSKSGGGTGVHGLATTGTGVWGQATTGTAVLGAASGAGTGVTGTGGAGGVGVDGAASDNRGGLFTSSTGYDVALGFPVAGGVVGSGRLGMVGRLDVGGSAPTFAPAFAVTSLGGGPTFEHEFVRGNDSSIWASRFVGSGANQSRWKRINAVRVDSTDGLGSPFKPKRVIDTRLLGAIRAAGSMNLVTIAGVGLGTSNIPADAVAVIGNLTAAGYTGGGWLSIMPGGIVVGTGAGQYNPASDPSSLNFQVGQTAIANSFVCGLSGGRLQVYVGGHSSHFLIDITGYMQ